MKAVVIVTLFIISHIALGQITQEIFFNSDCSGQASSRTWSLADKCLASNSGSFTKYSCASGSMTVSSFSDSACTTMTSGTQYPVDKCNNLLVASMYVKCNEPVPTGSSNTALVETFTGSSCTQSTGYTEYPLACHAASTTSRRNSCSATGLSLSVFDNPKCQNTADCNFNVNGTCNAGRRLLRCGGHSNKVSLILIVSAIFLFCGFAF